MKNSKTLFPARSVLMFGLLAALGFNLSWNPEHFTMSRADIIKQDGVNGFFDLASIRDPAEVAPVNAVNKSHLPSVADKKAGEFDLGVFDKDLAGVKVLFNVLDGNNVRYYIKAGERCPDCFRELQKITLSDEAFDSTEFLQRALAEAAIEKFGNRLGGAVVADPKSKNNITSKCDEETYADQTECEQNEFMALVQSCGDEPVIDDGEQLERRERREPKRDSRSGSRDACSKKAKAYFKKFLSKSIAGGLKAAPDSDRYQAAVDARDAMISDLSPNYDEARRFVTAASAQSVIERARNSYATTLSRTQSTDAATMAAKNMIATEMYGSSANALCSALTEQDCSTVLRNPTMRANFESNNDKFRMYTENYESSLKAILDHNDPSVSFDTFLNGQMAGANSQSGSVSEKIAAGRLGIIARNNAEPINGSGNGNGNGNSYSNGNGNGYGNGTLSIPNSLAAPSGQVWIPSLNPNNQQFQGQQQYQQFPGQQQQFQGQQQYQQFPGQQQQYQGQQQFPGIVPGQNLGNQNPQYYDSMNPVGNNGQFPLSPGQRQ